MNTSTITRSITGGIIIAVGVLALLGAMNIFDFGEIIGRWWPILLVLGAVIMYINNPRQILWPIIVAGIGILFQLRQLDLLNFNVWQLFWPIIIIGVGVSVLINKTGKHSKASDKDTTNLSVLLSGSDIKNHSDDYKGGSINATLGGVTLDLREAKIKKTATLNVFVMMGGLELTVPKNWKIQSNVTPILGGVDGRALETPEAGGPTLIITGDVMLGGVDIKH